MNMFITIDKEIIFSHNTLLNLQGGAKFPTGGKPGSMIPDSPRALFVLKTKGSADLVKFQSRRYSPDERGLERYNRFKHRLLVLLCVYLFIAVDF
jgi:hypothetical protein